MFGERCPLQHSNYDKMVTLEMSGIKLYYIQEQMFRLTDYFFCQFLQALSDANPYENCIRKYFDQQKQTDEDGIEWNISDDDEEEGKSSIDSKIKRARTVNPKIQKKMSNIYQSPS